MPNYDSYVICTSPRSGSTLLCHLLASTGIAGNPDSWFHHPSITAWLDFYNLTTDPEYSEREVLPQIFKAAKAKGSLKTGMFALRLQRHSFDYFYQQLSVLYAERRSALQRFETAFGRTLLIHLSRNDKVEQAVSYVKARQTGLWHRAPDGKELERLSPPQQPKYNTDDIRSQYQQMIEYDRGWESWFADEGIDPFRISYESLSADPLEMLRVLLDCLGLPTEAADDVEIGVAKLADHTNQKWTARFRCELDR